VTALGHPVQKRTDRHGAVGIGWADYGHKHAHHHHSGGSVARRRRILLSGPEVGLSRAKKRLPTEVPTRARSADGALSATTSESITSRRDRIASRIRAMPPIGQQFERPPDTRLRRLARAQIRPYAIPNPEPGFDCHRASPSRREYFAESVHDHMPFVIRWRRAFGVLAGVTALASNQPASSAEHPGGPAGRIAVASKAPGV